MTSIRIHADNILHRDRYLSRLNERIKHFAELQSAPSHRVIDDAPAADATDFSVPEIDVSELDLSVLKKAMREKGCLIVRNYFSEPEARELQSYVDYSFDLHANPETRLNRYLMKMVELEEALENTREDVALHRKTNSTYTDINRIAKNLGRVIGKANSQLTSKTPIASEKILALYEKKGLKSLLGDYFENDPCLSVYKWVLRKADSPPQPVDFHQDGAFMGEWVDSLNLWVALSNCGGDGREGPGMDILPMRLQSEFEKGSGILDWTVAEGAVVDKYGREGIVAPKFNRGDGFFFDHLLVHRTQHVPDCAHNRYAIETWFFDSVNFPKNQIPLKW